ncbi:auxin-induced in root cultures protein 12-like [Silene latifolia]|uniref:auxin-induced in root cultures protein 12-like n=1 Tax=Silene latifolia TaxID=37657 RepID=UPI003D780C97
MAFTAPPPNPQGWVAWGLNPTGSGMVGTQAILAYKPNSNSPIISVSTYDVKSYHDINMGPISYNVTGLSAEESNGKVTLFATWDLHLGESKINHVWQVGPVVGGKPGMHEFQHDNLGSKMILELGGEPTGTGVGSLADSKRKAGDLDLNPGSNGNAAGYALIESWKFGLVLGALLVFFL